MLQEKINTLIAHPQANKFLKYTNATLIYGSFFLPVLFSFVGEYKEFGSIAWFLLITIMVIRPLADIFPGFLLFRKLISIRRGLGIATGMAALTHGIGFFVQNPSTLGASYLWATNQLFLYGIIALAFSTLLLITSNNISVRFLGKYWKWLQRGVHGMFYITCIHVALTGHSGIDYGTLAVGMCIFGIRVFAWWKKREISVGRE